MVAGVPGEPGQHVQKPVELDPKAGKEFVLVTTLDMTNVLDHMRRHVTVTLKCAPVSHVFVILNRETVIKGKMNKAKSKIKTKTERFLA